MRISYRPEGAKRHTNFWNDHYWGEVTILALSACGRYAKIEGIVSWQRSGKAHQTNIKTEFLRPLRAELAARTQ